MTIKNYIARDIYINMTIKYSNDFKDLKEGKNHSPPCNCWLCLWHKYKDQTKHKKGKKYDLLTFFIWDLIFEVKQAYLKEKGIAKKTKWQGIDAWEYPSGIFNRVPYIRKVKEILGQIPGLDEIEFYYLGLDEYIKTRFEFDVKKKRFERPDFLKLLNKLEQEIWLDWVENQPNYLQMKKEWGKKQTFKFAHKVAKFIYSQPEKAVSQRILLRHFNKKQKELEAIWDILRLNYGIKIQTKKGYRKKTTLYSGSFETFKSRFWSVGLQKS